MSVSVECLAEVNDKIYFIEECCVDSKLNEIGKLDFDQSVIFNIGDQIKYLDWYEESVGCKLMTKIKFADRESQVFSAIESFFVTEDTWYNLQSYFTINIKRRSRYK